MMSSIPTVTLEDTDAPNGKKRDNIMDVYFNAPIVSVKKR